MYIDFDEHEAIHEAEMDGARKEGAEINAIQTALKMLKDGLLPDLVSKYSGLSKEEIRQLQVNNHLNPA